MITRHSVQKYDTVKREEKQKTEYHIERLLLLRDQVARNMRDNRVTMRGQRGIKLSFRFVKNVDQRRVTKRFSQSSYALPAIVAKDKTKSVIYRRTAVLHFP